VLRRKSYNVTRYLWLRQPRPNLPLKLHLTGSGNLNLFTAYGDDYVAVNGRRFGKSVIVMPDRIVEDWGAGGFDALSAEHMAALAGLDREVVLLGTGNVLRFPRPELMGPLAQAGLGVEVMDRKAACRTYNILASEGRRVAAALLFD
jgi:uncharacterized protein